MPELSAGFCFCRLDVRAITCLVGCGTQHSGHSQVCKALHLSRGAEWSCVWLCSQSGVSHFSTTTSSDASALKLWKPHFFEIQTFWKPGNLNMALFGQGLNHTLPILQLPTDGHDDLTTVNPGHCTLEFFEGACLSGV